MNICPNCNKEFNDSAQFCDNCGAPLTKMPETVQPMAVQPEAVQPEMAQPVAAQPEMVQPAAAQPEMAQPVAVQPEIYQPEAGQTVAPYVPKNKKRIPKKAILFGAIGVAVVAVLAIVLFIVFGGKASDENFALYIKDKEIFFSDLNKDRASLQLTSDFTDDADISEKDLVEKRFYIGLYINKSKDGRLIFFPDKFINGDDGYTLYYKELGRPDAEAIKIDSAVRSYSVNTAATLVTYTKGEEGNLYRYKVGEDSKEKLASNVSSFIASDDGNKLVYRNSESDLYLKTADKDEEKIATDVYSIEYVSEDLTCIYYVKERTLYKYVEGGDEVEITSDVYNVIKIYDSGEIYYIKEPDFEDTSLMDYINDDMKEADAAVVEPTAPSYPYWWKYSTNEEYDAASKAYTEAYKTYKTEYAAYTAKKKRDTLRNSLAEQTFDNYIYTLCYFNGTEETVVTDSSLVEYSIVDNTPVLSDETFNKANLNKVKLSEITGADDARRMVAAAVSSASERYIAVKGTATIIDQQKTDESILINENGTIAYYIDDVADGQNYGNLYRISIENGVVGKAEVYDSDVYTEQIFFINESKIRYFKDYKNDSGELYVDKEIIDYDVSYYMINNKTDSDKIFYFTDWDFDKDSGTLKVYQNGQSEKIEDDVHEFTISGDNRAVYLRDYNMDKHEGELYAWKNGETRKIDDDVVCIILMYQNKFDGYLY